MQPDEPARADLEPGDPGPVPEGVTALERAGAAEVEAALVHRDDALTYARARLRNATVELDKVKRPALDAFLDRIAIEAAKGGRRTDTSARLFVDILGLRQKVEILAMFFDRLGVDEATARSAIDMKRKLDGMDEDAISDSIARALGGYLKRKPDRRDRIVRLLELDSASGNGAG